MRSFSKYLSENKSTHIVDVVLIIYSGRFQPPCKHHYRVWNDILTLSSSITGCEVYCRIATSNKVSEESPFSFADKVKLLEEIFDVDPEYIVQTERPYFANEIVDPFTETYAKKNIAVIYVFGEKDDGREESFGENAQAVDLHDLDLTKLKTINNGVNYYEIEHVHIPLPEWSGFEEVSGSAVRSIILDEKLDQREKKILFKKIFGVVPNKSAMALLVDKIESAVD